MWFKLFVGAAVVAALSLLMIGAYQCDKAGGVYVKSVGVYRCVGGQR